MLGRKRTQGMMKRKPRLPVGPGFGDLPPAPPPAPPPPGSTGEQPGTSPLTLGPVASRKKFRRRVPPMA